MRAKKSLGQHFLKSKATLDTIYEVADINPLDIILEIGPGQGVLTESLAFFGGKVIAIEKDRQLVTFLKEKFREKIKAGRLEIIEGDVLDFDPEILRFYLKDKNLSYKIVANIPYYITGAILRKFLGASLQPEQMVLLVQKEVARRIVARDGKESLLSISVKCYGEPRYIKTVPARLFAPAPKVDSAIISIENISRKFFTENNIDEKRFFEIVRAGFAHKRKYLISNLKEAAPLDKNRGADSWPEIFQKCNLSEKSRAEDLSLEDWKCLTTSDKRLR